MVLWKALGMSNTKRIRTSAESIAMLIQRECIPDTGAYDTVKSTTSTMDDPSAYVLE